MSIIRVIELPELKERFEIEEVIRVYDVLDIDTLNIYETGLSISPPIESLIEHNKGKKK